MADLDTRWVLIAEDDDDIRQIIRQSLEAEAKDLKLEIVEASNGAEAIGRASMRQFHCVVTDLRMPKSTGEEFIRSLQVDPLNANTPTLVVSGNMQDEFREFCERYSHIRMIPKPFEPQEVAQAILREIRYGRLDDRIPLHLMNPFLEVVGKFILEDLHLAPNLEPPVVKKAGEGLMGDFHCTLSITTGHSRAHFTFSFDRSLLEHAKLEYFESRVSQWASLSSENLARYLVQAFFEKTSDQISTCLGGVPRLAGLSIVTSRDQTELQELVQSSGVTVVARTEKGRLWAGAFSRPKGKRA